MPKLSRFVQYAPKNAPSGGGSSALGDITGTTAYQTLYVDSAAVIRELPHGTSGYVLTSNGASSNVSWQAASSGLADIVDDVTPQLGANLDVNDFSITSATNGDVLLDPHGSGTLDLRAGSGGVSIITNAGNSDITINPHGTGNVLLGTMEFDSDQTIGAGQDNYVLTYDDSTGLISLEAAAGGGAASSLEYLGNSVATAQAGGLLVQDDSGSVADIDFASSTGTALGRLVATTSSFSFGASVNSASVSMTSLSSGGVARFLFLGDPDGESQMYRSGGIAMGTASLGGFVRDTAGSNPLLRFQNNSGGEEGWLYFGATGGYLRNYQNSQNFRFLMNNGAGTAVKIIDMSATGIGFYGTGPQAQPTSVAVTAAGIHAALVTLGLIT